MNMTYKVIREPEFQAALAGRFSPDMDPSYMSGVTWTLERDPHKGIRGAENVWLIKVL